MASTIAFACSRALSRIDFEKIGNWLLGVKTLAMKKLIEETKESKFLIERRNREIEKKFIELKNILDKLAEEIDSAMINVKESKDDDTLTEDDEEDEGMQLTYDSISTYMKTQKPEWSKNVQDIYNILLNGEHITVNEPIVVKALFDLAWNNEVITVNDENELDEVRVRNYIDNAFADCGVVTYLEDGKEKYRYRVSERTTRKPTDITLSQRFRNMDIPKGTYVYYYDTVNGKVVKVKGKVIGTNYREINPTSRQIFALKVYMETDSGDKEERTETDTYFLRDAPVRKTQKLWSTSSSARSRSRSRSPERIAMTFHREYPLHSFSELVAKPPRKEIEHAKPMKRRVRSESRSSSRERFRRRSENNEERSRSRSRSRSRDRFGHGGRKTRKTKK